MRAGGGVLFTSQQDTTTTTTTTTTNIRPTTNDTAEAATTPAPAGTGKTMTTTYGGLETQICLEPQVLFFYLTFFVFTNDKHNARPRGDG